MKGKLLNSYMINSDITVNAGEEVEIVDGYCVSDSYIYLCIMPDGTYKPINSFDIEITDHKPYVDWEQARIKAAIAAMQVYMAKERILYVTEKDLADKSVRLANILIERLKNGDRHY